MAWLAPRAVLVSGAMRLGRCRPPAPGHRRGHNHTTRPDRSIQTPELGLTRTPVRIIRKDANGEPHSLPMTGRLASHAPGLGRNGTFIEPFKPNVKDYFSVSVFFSLLRFPCVILGRDPRTQCHTLKIWPVAPWFPCQAQVCHDGGGGIGPSLSS